MEGDRLSSSATRECVTTHRRAPASHRSSRFDRRSSRSRLGPRCARRVRTGSDVLEREPADTARAWPAAPMGPPPPRTSRRPRSARRLRVVGCRSRRPTSCCRPRSAQPRRRPAKRSRNEEEVARAPVRSDQSHEQELARAGQAAFRRGAEGRKRAEHTGGDDERRRDRSGRYRRAAAPTA